jgi:hypothetical protein
MTSCQEDYWFTSELYADFCAHRVKPSHPQTQIWSYEEYYSPLPPSSRFISPLLVAILVISEARGGGATCLHTGQKVKHRTYLETPEKMYDVINMYLTAKGNSSNDRLIEMIL